MEFRRVLFRSESNGDVYPCPFLDVKVGNIFLESLDKIWQNEFLIKLRYLSWGKNIKGTCEKCKFNDICAGGCRARPLALSNIEYKDPLCWME